MHRHREFTSTAELELSTKGLSTPQLASNTTEWPVCYSGRSKNCTPWIMSWLSWLTKYLAQFDWNDVLVYVTYVSQYEYEYEYILETVRIQHRSTIIRPHPTPCHIMCIFLSCTKFYMNTDLNISIISTGHIVLLFTTTANHVIEPPCNR